MVILEKNNKISTPWVDKYLCPPVIWSHIFHRSRSRPIFISISLVDTKNPLRGILKFHIEADLKKLYMLIYQPYYYNCRPICIH